MQNVANSMHEVNVSAEICTKVAPVESVPVFRPRQKPGNLELIPCFGSTGDKVAAVIVYTLYV